MTGFGEARREENGVTVAVELRTINNRYFKISYRSSDGYNSLEPQIESVVRDRIKRGTLMVTLRVDRPVSADAYRLNTEVLTAYWRQLSELPSQWNFPRSSGLESLLALPGVVNEHAAASSHAQDDWPLISQALVAALDNLSHMRVDEGRAMAIDLKSNCGAITAELARIAERAPLMVDSYRSRLEERLNKVLADRGVTLNPADLIRELAIFAERADISEEIVRLRSHLEQFDALLNAPESSGRKLEFLIQEIFRETNTIGSKSTDVEIARHVIEIKAATERLREMIQNAE